MSQTRSEKYKKQKISIKKGKYTYNLPKNLKGWSIKGITIDWKPLHMWTTHPNGAIDIPQFWGRKLDKNEPTLPNTILKDSVGGMEISYYDR